MARAVCVGGAALSQGWERAAAGGSAHATDLLFAAVVQPVGPSVRRGAGIGCRWGRISHRQ